MYLNKKSLNILNLFLTLKKYSFTELEMILKIKKRSISMNINTINSFLHNHNINGIIKVGEIFFIDEKELLKIKDLLSHAPFTPTERRDYILLKLFFTNKIILSNSFIELDITRRTLNYDLERIKDYLIRYNLKLESLPSKGIFLIGNEINIRILFASYLTKYFIERESCHNLFINLINSIFSKKELSLAKKIVLNLINKMNISLPPEDFFKIVSIILIHSFREINFPCFYEEYKTPNKLLENKHYTVVTNFLKKYGLEELKLYELDLVIEILLSLDTEIYTKNLENEICEFLEKLEIKLKVSIPREKDFLMQISNAIRIGKFKAELNFLEHKELHKLDKEYKRYYTEISNTIKSIIPEFYLEDIIYLTILIKNTIDTISINRKEPKNIAIIDNSFNHIYGKMLLKYIKGNYYVNILKILDNYQLKDFLRNEHNIDFILTLSDINIKKFHVPTIKMDFDYILNSVCELEKHGFLKK